MRNEAEFCSAIVRSLNENGDLGWKIPDSAGMWTTSARVFDIMGRIYDRPLYIEAKFNKSFSAFNLNRIEPHQAYYLDEFNKISNAVCLILFGTNVSRGDVRSYIFKWDALTGLYKRGFSIHKKVLEKMPFNPVKKGLFSFFNVIDKELMKEMYGGDLYEQSSLQV